MLIYSDYLMIICWPCWYSVIIVSWPWSNNMLIWWWWLPSVPADIQSELSIDHVLIICWYTVIIWWLPAVLADIQSELSVDQDLMISWHTLINWWLPAVPADIQSGSSVDHVLIYSDYLIIICSRHLVLIKAPFRPLAWELPSKSVTASLLTSCVGIIIW